MTTSPPSKPKARPEARPEAVPQGVWEYVVSIAGHSGEDNPTAEDIQDYLQGLEEWYTAEKHP